MKQKVIFLGVRNKSLEEILALFGVYEFSDYSDEIESFFEFKNHFLEEKTQFIFLKIDKKFKKKLEKYFNENYANLRKIRTSVSFLKYNNRSNRWRLEALKLQ